MPLRPSRAMAYELILVPGKPAEKAFRGLGVP